jgi:hypothetical protein
MKKESPDDKDNSLRKENEEKRRKLSEEYGAVFGSMSGNAELPPEIESQFLDGIMAFENSWKDVKQVSLYKFLENPPYRRLEELNDTEISTELVRLLKIMNEHQVGLDTICEVTDKELYRFITEELFQHEIDDMHIPGMMTNFIYEEFHPNHEHEIRRHSTEFMQTYLDKESEYYTTFLSVEATKNDWHKYFRNAFGSLQLRKFKINDLNYNLEANTGMVDFECDFIAKVADSHEQFQFRGNGSFQMAYQWDFWCIDAVEFPLSHKV